MIYELSRSVEALMLEKNFPVMCVYGPERDKRALGTTTGVIVFEYDNQGTDTFTAPMGAQRNPRKILNWTIAATATVYARSSLPGAHKGDHDRECMRFVRGLICAIDRWSTGERCTAQPGDGGMLDRREFGEGFEQYPGAAYLFRFALPTAVTDLSYTPESAHTAGDGPPTHVVESVTNATTVLP